MARAILLKSREHWREIPATSLNVLRDVRASVTAGSQNITAIVQRLVFLEISSLRLSADRPRTDRGRGRAYRTGAGTIAPPYRHRKASVPDDGHVNRATGEPASGGPKPAGAGGAGVRRGHSPSWRFPCPLVPTASLAPAAVRRPAPPRPRCRLPADPFLLHGLGGVSCSRAAARRDHHGLSVAAMFVASAMAIFRQPEANVRVIQPRPDRHITSVSRSTGHRIDGRDRPQVQSRGDKGALFRAGRRDRVCGSPSWRGCRPRRAAITSSASWWAA